MDSVGRGLFVVRKKHETVLELQRGEEKKEFIFSYPMESILEKHSLVEDTHKIDYVKVMSKYGKTLKREDGSIVTKIDFSLIDLGLFWIGEKDVVETTIQLLTEIKDEKPTCLCIPL